MSLKHTAPSGSRPACSSRSLAKAPIQIPKLRVATGLHRNIRVRTHVPLEPENRTSVQITNAISIPGVHHYDSSLVGDHHHENGHAHGGIEAAEHQITHRAIEKGCFKLLECVAERLTCKELLSKVGGSAAVSAAGLSVMKAGQCAASKASASMTAAARAGEQLFEKTLAGLPSGTAAVCTARVHGAHGVGHGGRGVRVMVDQTLEKVLGNPLVSRHLTPAILNKIGRVAMVAVPAVGALFVSNLVMNDYQRLMQERRANNLPAAVGFVVALVCDTVDVVLHVFVAVGLMHHHFKVGLKLSHCLIHKAEHWALVLAAASTAAAAIAEVVAAQSPQSGHRGSDGATVHTLA